MTLINEILTLIALISAIVMPLYAIRRMNKIQDRIPNMEDFFSENEEGEVLIDSRIGGLIDAFGSRIAQSLKMSFLQGLGADAKISKGLKGAMATDIVDNKMPIINMVGDLLGFNTKMYISKHPEALGQLLQIAGPYLKNFNLGNLTNNGGGQTPNQGSVPSM